MSAYYVLLVFVPSVIWVMISKWIWPHHITLKEWFIQIGAVIISTALMWGLSFAMSVGWSTDHEVLNGYVTGKQDYHYEVAEQYACGQTCTRDSKGNRSCSTKYCTRYIPEVDWQVDTTVGRLNIDRVDRRGYRMPPRWNAVQVGEPASQTGFAQNYMLLDEHHFETSDQVWEQYQKDVPEYPDVYDYYRINRVINQTNLAYGWINPYLNDVLKKLGAEKQVNIVVVITAKPEQWYWAVRQAWHGTRRNDVILFYGVNGDGEIQWARADSFADGQQNNVLLQKLKVEALASGKIDRALMTSNIELITSDFKRLQNSQLAYLKSQWSPSITFLMVLTLINLAINIGLSIFMKQQDLGEFNGIRKQRW